jgi:peptidyl-Asp metalloendopeptidase
MRAGAKKRSCWARFYPKNETSCFSGVDQGHRHGLLARPAPDVEGMGPRWRRLAHGAGASAAPTGQLTPDQQAIVDKIAKPAAVPGARYAGAPIDSIGSEVTLPLGDGQSVTLVKTGSVLQKDGSVVWRGEVAETGERAMLMLWSNAPLTGHFVFNGKIFTVESLGGGVKAFAEMDRRRLPADHPEPSGRHDSVPTASPPAAAKERPALRPPPAEPAVAPFADLERQALEAKSITIDVMVLYTANVAKRYVREPADLLALAIEGANATFRNSGIGNVTLRLVHTQMIEYDETEDDQFTHLYTMVDGLGPFGNVRQLRDETHADIVGLIIDNPTGCGLSTRIGPTSDEAFFVVHHACAATTMSIAHEIGHILGARHDRFADENDAPVAYGHGYVNGSKWRDIMSYNAGCGGCPRIPYWSNPRVLYKGEPTGTPAADNARLILELAERVSNFR